MDLGLVFVGCHKRGGVERSVWELAKAWSTEHSVTVYARDYDEPAARVRHVPIHVDGPAFTRPVMFARAARREIASSRHHHVVSFGVGEVGADVLWVNSVHRAWLDFSSTFGDSGLHASPLRRLLPRHRVLLNAERRYFQAAGGKAVVVVADRVGEDLTRLYGVDPRSLTTIHNGFSPEEFSPALSAQKRAAARASIGLRPHDVALLMIANELPRKGFPVLLEAVARLDDPTVHILLAGRADPSRFISRVAELGLASRFHFLGASEHVIELHAASDLFVLPTKYEAFCLAVVESLASGLPVVTTKVPGAGDLVVDGHNGRLLDDPVDADALTGLLRSGLSAAVRQRWAAAAAHSVRELPWARIADQGLAVLEGRPSLSRV